MATKDNTEQSAAPEEGAVFMHMDDFLNLIHSETQHVEAIGAFARQKKSEGQWKATEEKWRADYKAFLNAIPQ